ncbi:reducing polyketide synthase rads1 [Podospora aff. communis PSN243]|uniref:Reducing polyketide synthase rads1 n=1 Tax=Podospora aff. communis PSN243 TaxID=3040156 RepID=A0AAV9GEK8_9PEZI|nr:reducing polyketide synthase rads1 [Podospora aff. communis PSN243]
MASTTANTPRAPIAIIGLACRFPGDASNPSKFWDLLKEGREAYSERTNRYNEDAFHYAGGDNRRQNVLPVKGGYMLKQDPYAWDAAFFNITAAEAIAFDPKQRIAMEVAYEAFENAGMTLQKVAGTQTACYIGTSMSDYRDSIVRDFGNYPKYHLLGTSDEMISNRISHFFDIHGPSATIETACSSSHVATHLACQSLQSGESEMALTGGIGMLLVPESTMQLNNLGFLSGFGQSRAFDASAGGYGRGEGCGLYVLKRLDKALRDGDTIRAVIRGSGVNQDGWTQGVTMPSGDAQAALIKSVYESNGLDYSLTQYVEAHGTGTQAGDPTEAGALYRTIGQGGQKPLWIGSVKTNIGHLEAAAGAASVIKGVLAMEHGFLPPTLHFRNPNPGIKWDEWNLAVPTKLTPWPACQTRRMSTSAFGMGGTNAHMVLERPANTPNQNMVSGYTHKKRLFVFSSHDQAGFKRLTDTFVEHLDRLGPAAASPEHLANLAHTLATARSGLSWRASCLADSAPELCEQLLTTLASNNNATRASPAQKKPRIGFVFTGQGAQWALMGVEMLERRVFGDSVAKSAELLRTMGCEWDPATELSRPQTESRLGVPEISQPICTVLQIALVDELRAWGISPSKVVGHSSGEIAAAYSIGALSHRDALAAAYYRGKASMSAGLTKSRQGSGTAGGMMAVGCSPEAAKALISKNNLSAQLTVACVNSPSSVTISGDVDALEILRAILEERGVFARRLKVDVAYHSSHMHACSSEYTAALEHLEPQAQDSEKSEPAVMVSSVTGSEVDPEMLGPYYWVRNLVSPVLFADALKELVSPADGSEGNAVDMLVEIGPHSALQGPTEQTLAHHSIKKVPYFSMLKRGQHALTTALGLAADLFGRGVAVAVAVANDDAHCRLLTDLPPYPWNHTQTFRADSRIQRELVAQKVPTKSIVGAEMPSMDESERVWRGFIRLEEEPWLRDHSVGTNVLFPGAGVISVVLEAAQQMVEPGKTARTFTLRDISFTALMSLSDGVATEVITHMRPHLVATTGSTPAAWWEFTVSSCAGPTGSLRTNCRGLISISYEDATGKNPHVARELAATNKTRIADYHRILRECPETCSKERFYDRLAESALRYGDIFQGVETCHPGNGQAAFEVKITDIGETFTRGKLTRPFLIHAAALDSILQAWAGTTSNNANGSGPSSFGFDAPMLPKSIGELEVSAAIPADVGYVMPGFSRSKKHGFNEWSAEIHVLDTERSQVLLSIADFRLAELEVDDAANSDRDADGVDPAEITSDVQWNFALDLLRPAEISQVLSSVAATTPHERLIELIRMEAHQRPAVNVVELVSSAECLADATTLRLPQGALLPTQIRYGVVSGSVDNSTQRDTMGRAFALSKPFSAADTATPADLFVIPHSIIADPTELGSVWDSLSSLAKPDATILMVAEEASVRVPGLELVSRTPTGIDSLALYQFATSKKALPERLTNGSVGQELVILEPSKSSTVTRDFSNELRDILEDQGYAVTTRMGIAQPGRDSVVGAKTVVSLLELERPILGSLSEADFEGIRGMILDCERLLWITRGEDPSLKLVDGFARCIRSEMAGIKFQLLHLSSGGRSDIRAGSTGHGAGLAARILLQEPADGGDSEFREHDGLPQVSRFYQSAEADEQVRNHLLDSARVASLPTGGDHVPLRLSIGRPGLLNTLQFVPEETGTALAPLDDDEVELEVRASGINFRDIMGSMGLLAVTGIGQEASGVVVRTGRLGAERGLKPGDRVSTLTAGGTHATRIRCDYRVAQKIPESMSFEEAAAVPVTHCTAYYALVRLAKLRRGQSVLVHAAAGGTGQAAVQLAKHMGLVVYATVGTEKKRRLMMDEYGLPEDHIFSSRDGSFVKGIERVTGGRGVDCVLNSLSGELLRLSFGCLATFGTFVEIGLRDITDNMRLDMRPFAKSTTFSFINMVTFLQENPGALGEILSDVFKLLAEGILRPAQPLTVYPVGRVEEAFRTMQQGKHLGKMILSFTADDGRAPILHRARDSLKLDPAATYLIVGGLGGLGRSLAMEFAASGARHIAFLSRSGDTKPEAKAVIEQLAARGVQARIYRADVADEVSFLRAMDDCSRELPPVKGVVQMAMVLRDVVFEKMKYDEWTTGLRPKVQGTQNLDQYFNHDRPLDFMILCSSIAGVFGNPSQAQYAAGNTYQDALANCRRARGLKAVSVNLGIMRDVGVIAEGDSHFMQAWEQVLGIREPAFRALMKSLINGQRVEHQGQDGRWTCPPQVCVGLGTGDIIAAHNLARPHYFQDPRFGPLAVTSAASASASSSGSKGDGAGQSIASKLSDVSANKDPAVAAGIVTEALVNTMANILRIPPSEVDPTQPMYRYGVDSLVALEVRNWITKEMKANMTLMEILAAVPMEAFAVQIAKKSKLLVGLAA